MRRHLLVIVFLSHALAAFSASPARGQHGANGDRGTAVVCATSSPVIHPRQAVQANVWPTSGVLTAPHTIVWTTSSGEIRGGLTAIWILPADLKPREEGTTVEASAVVSRGGKVIGRCTVNMLVVEPAAPPSIPERGLVSARSFVVSGKPPEAGYGLYSYLLLTHPPADDESRKRYVVAAEAFVTRISASEELGHYRRRSDLNLVIAFVKSSIDATGDLSDPVYVRKVAADMVARYDYARAAALAARLQIDTTAGGPYLATGLSATAERGSAVVLDASRVMPKLVKDWVDAFCSLTSGPVTWQQSTLTRTALAMRNVLALSAHATPEIASSIKDWLKVGKEIEK